MPYVARHFLLPLAFALAGCSNAQPGNAANADDANAIALAEENILLAAEAEARASGALAYPGSNAVAGDVIPGQEVMFIGDGLQVGIISLHPGQTYEFGRAKDDILAMATNLRGVPTASGTCREGPDYVDFGNLRVIFRQDRFVGWDAAPGDPPLRDEWSFHIGVGRDDITSFSDITYRRTARGYEFEAERVKGLLSSDRPDATVVDLWAGATCTPR